MPRSLKLSDSLKCSERFEQELVSQARRFKVVILDCLIEFLLSYVEKTNLHCLAAVFCENFFERNGFQSPFLVGSDTIFYFLSPKGIDCLVRLIKTRQKLINDQRLVGWCEA
jgi:hypothetical protein